MKVERNWRRDAETPRCREARETDGEGDQPIRNPWAPLRSGTASDTLIVRLIASLATCVSAKERITEFPAARARVLHPQ